MSDVSTSNGAVHATFTNGDVAIIIQYWEQAGAVTEAGARVDVRRASSVEGPAHRSGAEGVRIEPVGGGGGLWRADLLVRLDDGTESFHYHPEFHDDDVGERFFDEGLSTDPRGWIEDRLRDFPSLLTEAGAPELMESMDSVSHARSVPLMLVIIDAALAQVPAAMAASRR